MTRIGQRIADEIKARAKYRDFSIVDLSRKLEVTFEQTRRYVRGVHIPPDDQLYKICEVLDIPLEEALRLVELDRMTMLINQKPIADYPNLQIMCMLWPKLSKREQIQLVRAAYQFTKPKTMAATG